MAKPYTTTDKVRIKLKDDVKREYHENLIISAIEDADNLIDAYLCNYYDITGFSSSVGILKSISSSLAAGYVTGVAFQDIDQAASTWESKLYSWGKNTLKLIQDGSINIPGLTRIGT